MFADSLTIFGGILSGPVVYLGFMFLIILFISSIFAVGMSNPIAGESYVVFDAYNATVIFIFPAGNYMFKVNNRNTRTRCEICSKLTIKTPERR